MLVKLFWKNEPMKPSSGVLGTGRTGGHAVEFEAEINRWLADNPDINVIDVKQCASGGSYNESLWLISIWYEAKG
jgi:hypothetical protein